RNAELAKKFIALATSPQVQAEGIVKRFNWYPGIDASVVKPALDAKIWNQLFTDVTPSDLASYGKPFPLAQSLLLAFRIEASGGWGLANFEKAFGLYAADIALTAGVTVLATALTG